MLKQYRKVDLLRGKKLSTPVSFLASSIALFRANNAAQLMHIGGSPTAETECGICGFFISFFTSHQQSFSYVGMGLPGFNQCLARINASCSKITRQ